MQSTTDAYYAHKASEKEKTEKDRQKKRKEKHLPSKRSHRKALIHAKTQQGRHIKWQERNKHTHKYGCVREV